MPPELIKKKITTWEECSAVFLLLPFVIDLHGFSFTYSVWKLGC